MVSIAALMRYAEAGRTIEMIYMDAHRRFSRRTVKPIALEGGKLKAYCYTRRCVRIFSVSGILSASPAVRRASGI
ncbi:WYL domain-containing protein [Paenibacillus thermotolerans]|uniref:WYL domain-containing protein n=1 Tax=Paenibacillus thermotolerans TaxID=3027807 RepID=UPI002367E7B7|nr:MULTISPECIES: WYL domain-containing protein [unclassified Paenibacillus]